MEQRDYAFQRLIGQFETDQEQQLYMIIEQSQELKQKRAKDWSKQSRAQMPQTYSEFVASQIIAKKAHPKICCIQIVELITDKTVASFYQHIVERLQSMFEVIFPGVEATVVDNQGLKQQFQGQQLIQTSEVFDYLLKNREQPASNTCLFILTNAELVEKDVSVFGSSRLTLRMLIQSVSGHDSSYPDRSVASQDVAEPQLTKKISNYSLGLPSEQQNPNRDYKTDVERASETANQLRSNLSHSEYSVKRPHQATSLHTDDNSSPEHKIRFTEMPFQTNSFKDIAVERVCLPLQLSTVQRSKTVQRDQPTRQNLMLNIPESDFEESVSENAKSARNPKVNDIFQSRTEVNLISERLDSRRNQYQHENDILDRDLIVYRFLKHACHEVCHVFGLTNCSQYECIMNGTDHVWQADEKPFLFCPVCLRKLATYHKFKIFKTYQNVLTHMTELKNRAFSREIKVLEHLILELTSGGFQDGKEQKTKLCGCLGFLLPNKVQPGLFKFNI